MEDDNISILLPMIRRILPMSIAADIIGVQPTESLDRPMTTGTVYKDEASSYATDANIPDYYWCSLQLSWVSMKHTQYDLAVQWCIDTLGPRGDRWFTDVFKFCFYNEADRTLFAMKWA